MRKLICIDAIKNPISKNSLLSKGKPTQEIITDVEFTNKGKNKNQNQHQNNIHFRIALCHFD